MHKSVNNLIDIQNKLKFLNKNKIPKIIAVSKTFSNKDIIPLLEYGHKNFGENKIQEAVEKWSEMKKKLYDVELHMLGKMQTNKVKFLIPLFDGAQTKIFPSSINQLNQCISVTIGVNGADCSKFYCIVNSVFNVTISWICKDTSIT